MQHYAQQVAACLPLNVAHNDAEKTKVKHSNFKTIHVLANKTKTLKLFCTIVVIYYPVTASPLGGLLLALFIILFLAFISLRNS